jgi:hypothetical protein
VFGKLLSCCESAFEELTRRVWGLKYALVECVADARIKEKSCRARESSARLAAIIDTLKLAAVAVCDSGRSGSFNVLFLHYLTARVALQCPLRAHLRAAVGASVRMRIALDLDKCVLCCAQNARPTGRLLK